ncbi:MAG: SUMF1/EgtB/PvdO family nonheme iron enzyme [bacterium]|nr:SUMF1/EgtB/PvdO family nonheme iron enzyme [bacterium]
MSTTDGYAELEIDLHRVPAGGYQVELRFTDPAAEAEVAPERGTAVLDLAALLTLQLDPDTYGRTLADGLFHDANVRELYGRARAVTEAAGRFLRLRLLLGPSALGLHALRWELLCDPETGTPVATSERTLFSRFMLSRDYRPVELRPRAELKALVAVVAPSDLADYELSEIDVGAEVGRSRESMGAYGDGSGMAVEVIGEAEPVTLERLAARLNEGGDVLYLVCHGALLRSQVPVLFLQDEDGRTAQVEGEELARAVAGLRRPPRLVVLASCQSAGTEAGTTAAMTATAETSLAPLLAAAGVPAIVAMQGRITVQTVAKAMPVFFRELLRDGQIDRALAVARGAVRECHDAWMPALYLRLKRGCIWRQPGSDGEEEARRPAPGVPLLRAWPPPEFPEQPYPVLLPYTHPELMAGREEEIAELRRRLRTPVAILGLGAPSGTGKSSLLLAGLVPALRSEGRPVAVVRHPHEPGLAGHLLADLLDDAPESPDGDWHGFVERLGEVERLAGEAPLLVLDQLEDVLRPEADAARGRLGSLLAATTRRRPGTEEPLCRWLLAYRTEVHGELLSWLEDVLADAGDAAAALPYDLSGPDRFQGLALAPLATPPPGGDALAEATRRFQAAIEKPLATRTAAGRPSYGLRFAPEHAERLARAFAAARLARPEAPLVPELQVVLAHLVDRARPDGLLSLPGDPEELVGQALADHLRRALESAFPTGTAGAGTRRARALLALRELATTTGGRDEGVRADKLARAIDEDGERILEELATPLTRLVVLRDAPDGLRYVLSHDRMAEVVVRMVEEEGQHGKLLVDAELLALRRFVALKTALHLAGEENATRISRRQTRTIAAHAEALLWNEDRRAWWAAYRKRRRADLRRARALTAAALVLLALLSWGTWSWVRERQQRHALMAQVVGGEPGAALRALDELADDPETSDDALLALLRRRREARGVVMDVLEQGLGGIPEEDLNRVVLRTVELALPWVEENPEDQNLIANLVWALDYGPGRDSSSAAEVQALRDQVLEPLRKLRPPPPIAPDDPDWIEVPGGTFLMGSPEGEGKDDERPQHEVTVSAFRMLRHEVTNAEYRLLVPDHEGEDDLPAAYVSWYQATTWAAWLGGRLPTEAEWEYAARAGCLYAYCTRAGLEATVDDVAWTIRNSRDPATGEPVPSPVMQHEPNPWGFYDMLGNLWEWTTDWYAEYPARPLPAGPQHDRWGPAASGGGRMDRGGRRVDRGGSFWYRADWARVAKRYWVAPVNDSPYQGFRVLLPAAPHDREFKEKEGPSNLPEEPLEGHNSIDPR